MCTTITVNERARATSITSLLDRFKSDSVTEGKQYTKGIRIRPPGLVK